MNEYRKAVWRHTDSVTVLNQPIRMEAVLLHSGMNILLFGGDAPHIGSVAVLSPTGEMNIHTFPGHREDVICRTWAEAFQATEWKPAVISVGIHYDEIDRQGIQTVLDAADTLLSRLLEELTVYGKSSQKKKTVGY